MDDRLGSRLCENAQPIAQFVMGLFVARQACVISSIEVDASNPCTVQGDATLLSVMPQSGGQRHSLQPPGRVGEGRDLA